MADPIKKNSQSSRGFITVILFIVFPLFFTIFALSYALLSSVKQHTKSYFFCYKAGAKIQSQLKKNLKKLISLNKKVKNLRSKRKIAEKAFKMAQSTGEPISISTAYANLKLIKIQQKALYYKQKSLFIKSRADLRIGFQKFKSDTDDFLTNIKKQKEKPLAVKNNSPGEEYPDYALLKPFSKRQTLKLSWKMDHLKFFPVFLKEYLNMEGWSNHSCAVSLMGPGRDFKIRLMN